MALQRSPYPHAKIISIDTSAAKAMSGVIAVVIGDDLSEQLHVPAIPMVSGMKIPPHPLLARGAVHAAGTPVAAVVAESRALAQDAASAIVVEYEALPAVVNAEKALEPGAPLAREELEATCATSHGNQAAMSTRHSPRPSISFGCVSPARDWWRWRWSREASWRSRNRREI